MSRRLGDHYTAEERRQLAKCCESAVFQCLMNIYEQPEREDYWRYQADKLEQNFKTDFGRHYSYFTEKQE